MKLINLQLSLGELEHLITSIECAIQEAELLAQDLAWYSSENVERLETSLLILENQRAGQ